MSVSYLVRVKPTVNGTWVNLPISSTYDSQISTIVDGSRNANGVYVGNVVKSGYAKVTMSWKYLTATQWASLLALFEPNGTSMYSSVSGAFVNYVEFWDTLKNTYVLRKMYVSDRKSSMTQFDSNGNVKGYVNCSLSLIDTGETL